MKTLNNRTPQDRRAPRLVRGASIALCLLAGVTACDEDEDTSAASESTSILSYPIVDTNLGLCYNNTDQIDCPEAGDDFYGQDAQYTGNTPSYTDNGDGTVTDEVTGLIWTQEVSEASMAWEAADDYCAELTTGGRSDWRLPNIKELWSIRDFSQGWPWVDTNYFYLVGDGAEGAQQHSWSSNAYLVDTELAAKDVSFIVNDWTGHIKGLPGNRFVRCVVGTEYGDNDYVDNGDGTVSDRATGLMWAQDDNGAGVDWQTALEYAQTSSLAGYTDWRLPNIKELQSIADYSGVFPAIDTTVFNISSITNEAGNADYPYMWSGTTNPYIDSKDANHDYCYAWYVAFGYAVNTQGQDEHGAGAVRFDTKYEDGDEGIDAPRYFNYVRLVRGGVAEATPEGDPSTVDEDRTVSFPDGDTSGNNTAGAGEAGDAPTDGPDWEAGVSYLSALGITVTSAELEALVAGPPAPTAAELVESLSDAGYTLSETQAQALIDAIGLQ